MVDNKDVKQSRGVSPQLKAILLRMFREMYAKSAKNGRPITGFGLTEMDAESQLIELLDSMTQEQMGVVLKVAYALGLAMFSELIGKAGSSDRAAAWIASWRAKNAKGVPWTAPLDSLVLGILLASLVTADNPSALIDIMGEPEFVKMMAEKNAAKGAEAQVEEAEVPTT